MAAFIRIFVVLALMNVSNSSDTEKTVDDCTIVRRMYEEVRIFNSSEDYGNPQIKYNGTTVDDYSSEKHEEESVKYNLSGIYEYLKKSLDDYSSRRHEEKGAFNNISSIYEDLKKIFHGGATVDDYFSEVYEDLRNFFYCGQTGDDYSSEKNKVRTFKYKAWEDDEYFLKKVSGGATVVDYQRENYLYTLLETYLRQWRYFEKEFSCLLFYNKLKGNRNYKAIRYSHAIQNKTVSEFLSSVEKVTLKSVAQNISDTCGEYAERWTELRNKTCLVNWTKNWLKGKLEKAMELTVKKVSRECSGLHFCTRTLCNCTLAYEERFVKIVNEYVPYRTNLYLLDKPFFTDYLTISVWFYTINMQVTYDIIIYYHRLLNTVMHSVPTIEPFNDVNLIHANFIKFLTISQFGYEDNSKRPEYKPIINTREEVTWGIIRATYGTVYNQCEAYKHGHTIDRNILDNLITTCFEFYALQSYIDLISCVYQDQDSTSLTWSTPPSAFFHSSCLCLAYGYGCDVKAPKDVKPLHYCLSVLLRDFQRQITIRPAVTYLDYSSMTRVPICQFSYLLQENVYEMCKGYTRLRDFDSILSVQCSFYGLVNVNLNCSKINQTNTYDKTLLCKHYLFMNYVTCKGDVGDSLYFYSPGDSPLVLVLTYVDALVRLLTLVTYLSCPQLRNLPGKVLIGYQVTALLRLLVVRACLEDLALAVRLDVAFDFSSTLWLTSYLHFLTSSIKTLRLPDSLTPQEARMVLLLYSLLGSGLPAALSAIFFTMDEAIESHVQFGQILFVFCNYAALLWNLYMFYYNCLFYYDVKKNALSLKPGVKASTVFTGLFNFALKTSVLSGMGITIRLIFTQIHSLEKLLGYYHAFGTLQGLLVFFLYGCNREARDFWRRILCVTLRQRFRRQNTVV